MTSERLLNLSIEVLYFPKKFIPLPNKFLATPLACMYIIIIIRITIIIHSSSCSSSNKNHVTDRTQWSSVGKCTHIVCVQDASGRLQNSSTQWICSHQSALMLPAGTYDQHHQVDCLPVLHIIITR